MKQLATTTFLAALVLLVLAMGISAYAMHEPHYKSSIGGTVVPSGLHCAEDEVISWTGPDTLDCVHYELIN